MDIRIAIIKQLIAALTALVALLSPVQPHFGAVDTTKLSYPSKMPGYYAVQLECFKDRASFDIVANRNPYNQTFYQYTKELVTSSITISDGKTVKIVDNPCPSGLWLEVSHTLNAQNQSDAALNAKNLYKTEEVAVRLTQGTTTFASDITQKVLEKVILAQ